MEVQPGRPARMDAGTVAEHARGTDPSAIAATVSWLVRSGRLQPGDRLPTVRALASALGVSPGTVSAAFQALSAVGLIASRGRAGTHVLPPAATWLPPRYQRLSGSADEPGRQTPEPWLDLSSGTPDPLLLPSMRKALVRAAGLAPVADTHRYVDVPLLPELEGLLRQSWPFQAQRLTVVNGGMDAIARTLEQVVRFGDPVAVEDPGFPPFFDLLDQLGAVRAPVALDRAGVRPGSLAKALDAGARVLVLQPRAQNPTGVDMSPTRARELTRVLRAHPHVLVIEDDHSGQIASARDVTLGGFLPDRVVHVRSFSKSHGPDLRIAAVGGPARVLDAVVRRRMLGPGWTSRLVQRMLADMLDDGEVIDVVSHARRVYHARRRALLGALAEHHVDLPLGDGINLWLPVRDEQRAVAQLAAAGIRVSPGAPFHATAQPRGGDHVRVSLGLLRDEVPAVAAALARAAAA
ncbi:PLP-dependent aminotransferase family protein [Xylanimonas ulmi]|uniref:DNA-binding transcriptional MocR family regulator n=1 Tax=Xylanimonas ulmi TaxID=228973 RepID=A0A4Q7M381_9MICO|nr:aminotransferase class I/II-fold pyridoxal phosphate-dependent enzyme [Xylanibacterium ulmi]RZS60389.1 DNA-binding transcriptional MocR family regulator [Xylanibacterium ulmi]